MSETALPISIERLRGFIGREVQYNGKVCRIIEILEDDGLSLILQHTEQLTHIQPDQHGEAHRRVPTTITIPVLDDEGNNYSPAFKKLDLL